MVCHKCGHELTGKENFCSWCGEKIEKNDLESEKHADFSFADSADTTEKRNFVKPQIPDMNWNVAEFKPVANKKEDPVIFWRTEDMFMGKELKESKQKSAFSNEDEVALVASEDKEKDKEVEAVDFEVPEIFNQKKEEERKPSFLVDSGLFYQDEEALSVDDEKRDFIKEEIDILKEIKENDVFQRDENLLEKDENIVEIEQPNGNIEVEIVGEDKKEVAVKYEPEMTRVILDDNELENIENIINEVKRSEEDFKEETVSLFDEIAEGVVDTLENSKIDEEKKRIDKFYTFNRKKEEFQKLLDKEYEKIERNVESGGLEKDVASFIDVEIGKEVESTSQLEEMVKAREIFFDSPVELENEELNLDDEDLDEVDISKYELEEEIAEDDLKEQELLNGDDKDDKLENEDIVLDNVETIKEEETQSQSVSDEKEKPEFLKDKKKEFVQVLYTENTNNDDDVNKFLGEAKQEGMKLDIGENGDPSRVVIEPKMTAQSDNKEREKLEEEFFKDSEDKNRSKGFKILIGFLVALLIIVGGLFTIRVTMPTSYISQYIDEISNKIFSVFQSSSKDENKSEEVVKKEKVQEPTDESKEEDIVEKSVTTKEEQ